MSIAHAKLENDATVKSQTAVHRERKTSNKREMLMSRKRMVDKVSSDLARMQNVAFCILNSAAGAPLMKCALVDVRHINFTDAPVFYRTC